MVDTAVPCLIVTFVPIERHRHLSASFGGSYVTGKLSLVVCGKWSRQILHVICQQGAGAVEGVVIELIGPLVGELARDPLARVVVVPNVVLGDTD